MPKWICVLAVVLAAGLAGCNTVDSQYYRVGIGTELPSATVVADTNLEDQYVASLCRRVTGDSVCPDWDDFVTAGMNDLDQRCDGYLAWLDDRRRSVAPVLQQINDSSTAASAMLFATGAGTEAMAIATAAFGFASGSFTNFNSRLLYEVDHATVQSIVLGNQTRFREDVRTKRITTRPDAIYALRQYLRICMPFTIETEINNTLTAFSSGGARALAMRPPLIGTSALDPLPALAPATPRMRVAPRRFDVAALKPSDPRTLLVADPKLLVQDNELDRALAAICVGPSDIANRKTPESMGRIKVFQQFMKAFGGDNISAPTGRLTEFEIAFAAGKGRCDRGKFQNYYEVDRLGDGLTSPDIVTLLNKNLNSDAQLSPGAGQDEIRRAIATIRAQIGDRLTLTDSSISGQFSNDFMIALRR